MYVSCVACVSVTTSKTALQFSFLCFALKGTISSMCGGLAVKRSDGESSEGQNIQDGEGGKISGGELAKGQNV